MTQPAPAPTAPPVVPTPPAPPAPTPTPPGPPAPPTPPGPPADPPDDKPLGPGGERALAAERDARKLLEKQLAELSPLKKLAEALGAGTPAAGGKSEVELLQERFNEHEKQLAEERSGRFRAEVAAEKGLTAAQAARLQGATREELAADADALLAMFPTATPRTPVPDPSQGTRGAQPANLDAQIAEAQKDRDVRTVLKLQKQKFLTKTP